MIDVSGPFLLILILNGVSLETEEVESFDACKAVLTQLEPIRAIEGYCVAKTLIKN